MPFIRTPEIEMLDQIGGKASAVELAGNLRDIRLANRWFGGTSAVVTALAPLLRAHCGDEPISILDVATGSADIPIAIAAWAEREHCPVRIVATDRQTEVLAIARAAERCAGISIEQADALNLPYPNDSFDVVTLSLALHHFEPDDAVRVLEEMARVGQQALIVNDLERSRTGYAGAWLFGHLLTTNRMTRNDAPLSVRRAYTPAEALALAHRAGWRGSQVRGVLAFRYVLTGRPP